MTRFVIAMLFMIVSTSIYGAGVITGVNFSGPDDPNHPNIIQIQLEGGFNAAGCDPRFAAIRNTPEREHMISFILSAYISKEPVVVLLNTQDKYYAQRCTIARVSSQ